MNLFLRSLFFSIIAVLVCSSLVSCDRYEYPLGKVEAPAEVPEYSVNPDINTSPAKAENPAP